jgi:uncharacterized membrane protein YfcA
VPLTIEQYLLIALILLLSSMLQGAIGFASGMFGIPLLMLVTGIPLPDAVAMSLVAATVQNLTAAYRTRRDIDFRLSWRPMLIRLAVMPLGVVALYYLGTSSRELCSQAVGCVVLARVATLHLRRVPPQPKLHVGWEWLAFTLAGFLLGFCGMGGPPMVLWVLAHDWTSRRGRAFLFFLFSTSMIPQGICLVLLFGWDILWSMAIGAAATPLLFAGTLLGLHLATYVSERWLRRASTIILVLIGLSSIVLPFLRR